MQPLLGASPFDDPDYLFEPWWPGLRAFAFVEGGKLRLRAEGLADVDEAFAELHDELPAQVRGDGLVIDGSLLVLDDAGRIDTTLLRARIGGSPLAGRPAYVAGDLLWSDGEPWTRRRFEERRERLRSILVDGDRCVVGRAFPREGTILAEALGRMGIRAMSARRLDGRFREGGASEAWLRIPIEAPDAAEDSPPRPSLALIQRLPLPVD